MTNDEPTVQVPVSQIKMAVHYLICDTVQVPVSQIKMAVHYLGRGGFRALAGQLQDALLSQPPVSLPTREHIEEFLTSWFPEYEGVGSVINDAAAEIARVRVTPVDIGRLAADAQSLRKSNPAMAARVAAATDEITRLRALLSQPTAEPPRIEDMAPGTTFGDGQHRYTVEPIMLREVRRDDGQKFYADEVDPATIRDVTPPKE